MGKCKTCKKTAYFNYSGNTIGVYCKEHALEGMVNVVDKKCQEPQCDKRPLYNMPGIKPPVYCKMHALHGMIDVMNPRCVETGCTKHSVCNFPGQPRLYCNEHKKPGMCDVVSKRCEFSGCDTHAKFNFSDMKRGRFCAQHKLEGMIHVETGLCQYINGCNASGAYSVKTSGKQVFYCRKHRPSATIPDTHHSLCRHTGCVTRASFNVFGDHRERYCVEHKTADMVHKETYPCSECKMPWRFRDSDSRKNEDRLCPYCDPNYQYTPRETVWEDRVEEILRTHFPSIVFLRDVSIDRIPGIDISRVFHKYRPDFVANIGTVETPQLLIIECDENQHLTYDITNETMRECMIHHILSGIPTIMIRFNPCMYKKTGQTKRTDVQWEKRQEMMCSFVEKCMIPVNNECSLFRVFDTYSHLTFLICYDIGTGTNEDVMSSSVIVQNENGIRRRMYDRTLIELTRSFVRV